MSTGHTPLVQALLRPDAYPEKVASVELVETHISYLFLTGQHVYKVKKPVDFGFLDFTALDKRRHFCHQEVEVNRRIAPEVYLGVVEIREEGGRYTVEGPGRTVEYAVKMLQLPRERAMSVLLEQDAVTEDDLRRLAALIADFHRRAETSPEIARLGDPATLRRNMRENFRQTEKYVGLCLSRDAYDDMLAYSEACLAVRAPLLTRRAQEGRVRDCHGDLHTEQIFLTNGFGIIDAIEFNRRFRYSDVALDVAFLAMDMDFHGRRDLSDAFVRAYVEESGDGGVWEVLDPFKAYRAYVRGKVASFRLDDPQLLDEEREEVLATARAYFRLAHSYTPSIARPSLILVAGLMGTGKSYVSQELARRWDLTHISSDITRKELADVPLGEHRYEPFGWGIYSPELTQQTYEEMLRQAEGQLRQGRSVVLDASFRTGSARQAAVRMAEDLGIPAWVVECTASEDKLARRLELRQARGTSVSDGRWELFHQQKEEWEPVTEVPSGRYVRLDTGGSHRNTMLQLLRQLYTRLIQQPEHSAKRVLGS